MTDPNAEPDLPPAKPPRPSHHATTTARSQLEADELYARQLSEHYNRRAPSSRWDDERQYQQSRDSDNPEERDYSFFDGMSSNLLLLLYVLQLTAVAVDDLPVIRDNIRKGFLETQSKVNSWVQNLKKRIDGEEVEDEHQSGQSYETQNYGRSRQSGELGRRSGDREHYDADPQLLSDDFTGLELRDSEGQESSPMVLYSVIPANIYSSCPTASSKAALKLRSAEYFVILPSSAQGVIPRRPADRN